MVNAESFYLSSDEIFQHSLNWRLYEVFIFSAAHSPVRLDIGTKFPYFLFLTWLSKIRNQEFRLHI